MGEPWQPIEKIATLEKEVGETLTRLQEANKAIHELVGLLKEQIGRDDTMNSDDYLDGLQDRTNDAISTYEDTNGD